jgi:hypothetical protein
MPSYIRFFFFSLIGLAVFSSGRNFNTPAEIMEGHFAYVDPQGRLPVQNISTLANCQGPNSAYFTITKIQSN